MAGRIPDSFIQDLIARTDIVQVIGERLDLTAEEREQFNAGADWSQQHLREITEKARSDRQQAQRLWDDYRRQLRERYNRVLTPEQQRAWSRLTGELYNFRPQLEPAPR